MSGRLIIILVIALIFAYNLVSQIASSLKSGDKLTQAQTELQNLETKNVQLQAQLQQANSPQFVEQQARDKLGLAKPGETIVVIPSDKISQVLGETAKTAQEVRLPNWQGWLKLFWN